MYYLIGNPLGHSHSPFIHRALGRYDYALKPLEANELEAFIKEGDYEGLNVTIPYKQAVIPFLDEIDDAAKKIGSVNTVVRRDGKLYGYNTDYHGFFMMSYVKGISFKDQKVVVLGSGGTSLTACAVARDLGAASVTVISRSGENNYGNLHLHADADILINTTPVGMFPHNGESPVDLSIFNHLSGVLDVVYNPLRTALIMQAEEKSIPAVGGLYMLVAQAAVSCGLFTGDKPQRKEIDDIHRAIANHVANIILVGMPGCGKSTVAEILAQKEGRRVIDTDALITERTGKTPAEIIKEEGEETFRRYESEAIKEAGKQSNAIIATGGGAVTREENLAPLKQNGKIALILRPLDLLARADRPLSTGDLRALYRNRLPKYVRFADFSVENITTPEECADEILRNFHA
ncbi:MAG: AAA family ATPase [Clostridia bacterium]|nr:AAA family ATPase [Clostridia bacterium]